MDFNGVTLTLILCLCIAACDAFVLRRPAMPRGTNRLAAALGAIERQRRRIEEESYPRMDYDPYRKLYPFEDVDMSESEEDSSDMDVKEELLMRLLQSGALESGSDETDEDSVTNEDTSAIMDADPKRSQYSFKAMHAPSSDISELENIFKPSKDEKEHDKKRNIPWQIGGNQNEDAERRRKRPSYAEEEEEEEEKKKRQDSGEEESSEESSIESSEELVSASEVAELLSGVDKTEKDILNADNDDQLKKEVVDVKELQSVFEEEGDGPPKGNTIEVEEVSHGEVPGTMEKEISIKEGGPKGLNKELLLGPYSESFPSQKKKRSDITTEDLENTEEDLNIEFIKTFIKLEDDENTNLANALNLATLAQVERNDKFIPDEIEYLKKAIADEQVIRDMKKMADVDLDEDESSEEEDFSSESEEESDEEEMIRKRNDPSVEEEEEEMEEFEKARMMEKFRSYLDRAEVDSSEQEEEEEAEEESLEYPPIEDQEKWYDSPVYEEGISGSEELELNPFLRALWEKYRREEQEEEEEEVEEPSFESPEISSEENELSPVEAEEVLRGYLSNLNPRERQALKQEVQNELNNIRKRGEPEGESEEEGFCPAIENLDDCYFAKSLGLKLDEEALDLCNRHQMCYQCGAAHDLSMEDCDNGYMLEAVSLCEQDEECKDDAAGLYLLMVKAHDYLPHHKTDYVCKAHCVLEYIYGPDEDK